MTRAAIYVRKSTSAGLEQEFDPLARPDFEVMLALRANIEIGLKLRLIENCPTPQALGPQAFGDRTRAALGLDARGNDSLKPGHALF